MKVFDPKTDRVLCYTIALDRFLDRTFSLDRFLNFKLSLDRFFIGGIEMSSVDLTIIRVCWVRLRRGYNKVGKVRLG